MRDAGTAESLGKLVEDMNCGFGVWDAGGVFRYANQKLCEMLGYRRNELEGRPLDDYCDGADRERLEQERERRRRGSSRPFEVVLTRRDGTRLAALVLPRPIKDKNGRFRGASGAIIDITAVADAGNDRRRRAINLALAGLRQVVDGLRELDALQDPIVTNLYAGHFPELLALSPREWEILRNLLAGRRVGSIATALKISDHTVRNHLKAIFRKTGVGSQAELIEKLKGG